MFPSDRPERREARLARYPGTSLQIFRVSKKFAGSADVVIRKQGISIVDTRVPAIAITRPSISYMGCRNLPHRNLDFDILAHGNQIFLGGRRLGGHRLLTPDLHRTESASSHYEMIPVHKKRLTLIMGMCEIFCHQRAFEIPIYWGQRAREDWKQGEAAVVLGYDHYGGKT